MVENDRLNSNSLIGRWQPLLFLSALYLLTFLVIGSALRVEYGFPLDDSYIHQTVARNLARTGTPGFYPGQRSSGTTSLVWTVIQAANYRLLHGIDPVLYNLAISCVLLALIGPLLFVLARRDGLPQQTCWVLAAGPALCGNFVWLGMIGMEHLLFVVLTLAAIYLWFETGRRRSSEALLTGLVAGLLALTRPEAMIFGPLLFVTFAKARRPFPDALKAAVVWVLFVCASFGANEYTSHSLMPATLKGRTWLYFHNSGGPHTLQSITRFIGSWMQRMPRLFSTRWVEQMRSLHDVHGTFAILCFALTFIVFAGAVMLVMQKPLRAGFLVLWATVHFLTYLVTFPGGGHGGRYQPLSLLLLFPLLFLPLAWLLNRIPRLSPRARNTLLGASMLLCGFFSLRTWRTVTVYSIAHINQTHGTVARWMLEHLPPDTQVAAFDIGRISYTWDRKLLDLGGLADPSYTPYLISGRIPEYLEMKNVHYVVLQYGGAKEFGFTSDPRVHMQELLNVCSPYDRWEIGFRYTIHAVRCQELYRIDYGRPAAPAS